MDKTRRATTMKYKTFLRNRPRAYFSFLMKKNHFILFDSLIFFIFCSQLKPRSHPDVDDGRPQSHQPRRVRGAHLQLRARRRQPLFRQVV
ncbi:hypothetical protein TNIN_219571 [Trichonephila inaurata madagascariensis]|uniref:Uncharacterized protein n=1 Tax=Trichonephila inaurata madagascariensis TaxID=2747483 RepID=A0A8X7C9N7_9ARAC|nr:hypothetical protein TNIN_219571 [Trichonephila inaurata madagascariensis]